MVDRSPQFPDRQTEIRRERPLEQASRVVGPAVAAAVVLGLYFAQPNLDGLLPEMPEIPEMPDLEAIADRIGGILPGAGDTDRERREAQREARKKAERKARKPPPGQASKKPDRAGGNAWRVHFDAARDALDEGDHERAEVEYLNALHEAEKLGEDAAALTSVLDYLGYFYGQRGRHAEAIPLYLRARAGYEKRLGREHEDFVGIERRIAYAYRETGDWGNALAHLYSAIDSAAKVHGPDYIGIAYGYREAGDILRRSGDENAAVGEYRRALALIERTAGPKHELAKDLRKILR